jgi:hypothetical protein
MYAIFIYLTDIYILLLQHLNRRHLLRQLVRHYHHRRHRRRLCWLYLLEVCYLLCLYQLHRHLNRLHHLVDRRLRRLRHRRL